MAELVAPEIPRTQNPMDSFFHGFSLMAAVAQKRSQSELAMERLKNQAVANQLRAEQQIQEEQDKTKHWADVASSTDRLRTIQEATYDLKKEQMTGAMQSATQDTNRLIDMQSQLYSIPAKKGTTDYQNQFDDIKNQFSDVTGTAPAKRILTPLEQNHKMARQEAFKSFNNQIESLGINPANAASIFATPELFQQADSPKGQMQFQMGTDPNTKKPRIVTVPKKRYDELKGQFNEFNDLGSATVPAPTRLDRARQAIDDPDATVQEKAAAQAIIQANGQ